MTIELIKKHSTQFNNKVQNYHVKVFCGQIVLPNMFLLILLICEVYNPFLGTAMHIQYIAVTNQLPVQCNVKDLRVPLRINT